jgi:septal ring factor EnvC (AmiA/AmiB activator)
MQVDGMIKATEKRLSALEKQNEAIEKSIEAIDKKIGLLENAVATVVASLKDPKKFVEKAGAEFLDKSQAEKISAAVAEREAEKAISAMQKQFKDTNIDIRFRNLEAILSGRIKVVEALVATLQRR